MKFAPVLPINLYPALDMGLYHLVQAHLFPNAEEEVVKWFKDRDKTSGHFTILDNGLWELGAANVQAVYDAAALINPSCIVLPDVLGDAQGTFNNLETYIEMAELAPYAMVVPQGENLAEWCSCAYKMLVYLHERDIQFIIGVPKILDSYQPEFEFSGRLDVVTWLFDIAPEIRVHLLGLWHGLEDLDDPHWNIFRNKIDGADSTLPFAHAMGEAYTHRRAPKAIIGKNIWTKSSEFFSKEEIWRARLNISVTNRYVTNAR